MNRLAAELGLTRLTARALVCRGVSQPEEARRFLTHDLTGLGDPNQMKDMDQAVGLLEQALAQRALIRIYGDYDVDGVCATAMLVRALRRLDGRVDWYIPHRVDEGYGVNEEAVRQAKEDGVGLLVTVDCGSTARREVALARELGLQVLITDHHRLGDSVGPEDPSAEFALSAANGLRAGLPPAPVLNPWRQDCAYPFKELAGVGVAFKLVTALARSRGLPEGAEFNFLDLVCLGTIGDVVPLLGENRVLVQNGLLRIPRSRKVGLSALLAASGLNGAIGSRQVAFGLAPRINAAGRMEHAEAAVKLLLTQDRDEAAELASHLCQQNDRRRQQEQQTLAEADDLLSREVDLDRDKVVVLASESWHPGVIGIVASRLVERYHRPTLLIALRDGIGKGSGRSIAALDLWQALRECEPILTRYGGHHYAAGFSLPADRVAELRQRMNEVADRWLTAEDLVREIGLDGEASLEELSPEAVGELGRLEPFGMGNPAPLVVTAGLCISKLTPIGDGAHLALRLRDESGRTAEAVWFGQGRQAGALAPAAAVDVCHRPRLDEWNGNLRVRLYVEDVCLSGVA